MHVSIQSPPSLGILQYQQHARVLVTIHLQQGALHKAEHVAEEHALPFIGNTEAHPPGDRQDNMHLHGVAFLTSCIPSYASACTVSPT